MKEIKTINPVAFGLVYFIMFVISLGLNHSDQVIMYPLVGPNFLKNELRNAFIGIGVGFLVVLISQIVSQRIKAMQDLSHEFFRLMGPLKIEEIFFLAFFSSVGEEFLFRGIIQGHLGLFVATMIFGLLHTAPGKKGMIWSSFALIMGLVLGLLYMGTKSIITPIWTHFIINFFNLYFLQRSFTNQDPPNNSTK